MSAMWFAFLIVIFYLVTFVWVPEHRKSNEAHEEAIAHRHVTWRDWILQALRAKDRGQQKVSLDCHDCGKSFTRSINNVLGENTEKVAKGCIRCKTALNRNSSVFKKAYQEALKTI